MSELRSYFERWQRLEDERKALGDDLKELFAEAKGNGFAPKAMRIAFRSIVAAENESDGDRETAAQVELYVNEITGSRAHSAPARTREGGIDAKSAGTIINGVQTEIGRKALVSALDVMIDAETGEITEQPETATRPGQDTKCPSQRASAGENFGATVGETTAGERHVEATVEQRSPATNSKPAKTIADYRPNCRNPEQCGASGLDHCFSCKQAMAGALT